MILIISTFFIAIASALCPLVNLEVYVAGVGALGKSFGVLPVSFAAAGGQVLGKLVWYQVGRSSMNWPFIARKMSSPAWQRCYTRLQARIEHRAWAGMGLVLLSAAVGLPPLAIMAVLCGQLRFSRTLFCGMTFVGRAARFAVVLGGSGWVAGAWE